MAITTKVKHWANNWLALANLRIETRIAERAEMDRLLSLEHAGHFRRQVLPILPQIARCDPNPLLEAIEKYRDRSTPSPASTPCSR